MIKVKIDNFYKAIFCCVFLFFGTIQTSAAQDTVLLFQEETPKGCVWLAVDLLTHHPSPLQLTRQCSNLVIFDQLGKQNWLVEGEEIAVYPWQGSGEEKALAKFPMEWRADAFSLVDFWLDQKTRQPRVALLEAVREEAIEVQGKHQIWYYSGGTLKVDVAREGWVDWGLPAVAAVYQWDKSRWREVAKAATKMEAGDTPGISVLEKYIRSAKDSVTLQQLLMAATCLEQGCLQEGEESSPLPWPEIKSKLTGALTADDELNAGFVAWPGEGVVVFNMLFGDTPHASAPLLFCDSQFRHPVLTQTGEGRQRQIGLSRQGEYLLVTDEYSGNKPSVYRFAQKEPEFAYMNGKHAVWLPYAGMLKP